MAAETAAFVAAFVGQPAPTNVTQQHVGSTCKALVAASTHTDLLGSSPEEQAQVDEWLLWAASELHTLTDDKLHKVNAHLLNRTFLVANRLTLADLVMFGTTHAANVAFPQAQLLHFLALLRWADLIQARAGEGLVAKTFAKGTIKLSKPAYVAPPPPPPPAPKAAAGAAPTTSAPAKGAAGAAAPDAAAAAKAGKADKAAAAPATATATTAATAAPKAAAAEGGKEAAAAASSKGEAKGSKGEKKEKAEGKKGGEAAGAGAAGGDDEVRIDMLDIRVGKIVKVDKHPNADALYLEEIDVGEEKPRQVISGLVKFVPKEEMQDRMVAVVLNLKPAKMREVMSYGMVLCASNDTHDVVVPVGVPAGSVPGDRVVVAGFEAPALEEINPKKKILERLFPDMKTDAGGVPCFKGVAMATEKGPLTSPVPNAWVK